MDAEELLKKRMKELAQKSYQQSIYCNTSFLGLLEQSIYHCMEREVFYASPHLLGGYEQAERKILMFGSKDLFGYEEKPPICILKVEAIDKKFSDSFTHRDYLGAILNLGIERECIGDIVVEEEKAYVFCMEHMANFLCEQLTKIKRTLVKVSIEKMENLKVNPKRKAVEGFVTSFRLDVIISLAFSLSRKESSLFIKGKKVFVDGRLIENGSKILEPGNVISVRGKGKFLFDEIKGKSKKGRDFVILQQYV